MSETAKTKPCCTGADYLRRAGLKVGDRVRLRRDVERFPHFIAREGLAGVIVPGDAVWVSMTEHLPGAEEWGNSISWYDDDLAELAGDLELDRPKEKHMGYDNVIEEYLKQLAELVDKNRDDAHDLASWITALDLYKSSLMREFNDHLLEAVRSIAAQKEIVREVVFHTVRTGDNK